MYAARPTFCPSPAVLGRLRNLFNTPEVQAELKLLPLSADLACSPLILQALAETANEDTLETDTVPSFI